MAHFSGIAVVNAVTSGLPLLLHANVHVNIGLFKAFKLIFTLSSEWL